MILFPKIPWVSIPETDSIAGESKTPVFPGESRTIPIVPTFSSSPPVFSGAEVSKAAAAALGLPLDALSITLLTFARLFSLSPGPELMVTLRKDILASGSSSPKTAKEKAMMEAKALSAIAAADKGLSLSEESLKVYAALPGSDDFSGDQRHGEEQQNEDTFDFFDFMNGIPGKNGQQWIVWPFNLTVGGTELKVLVRLLIKEPLLNFSDGGGIVIADITGSRRNWQFFLNKSEKGKLEAQITVFPGLALNDAKVMQKELEDAFKNIAVETAIRFRNGEELASLAEVLGNETLPSVNEKV